MDWLIGWLVDWLVGWLVSKSISYLFKNKQISLKGPS
jgi:hypothetical protein